MTTLEEMSGERTKVPKLSLNEVRLNGQTGKFVYKDVLGGRTEKDGDKEKYKETEIGDEVKLVFLKIRRKLVGFRKGETNLVSVEHSTKNSQITLYGDETITASNEVLRGKYPCLKTQQIIYALYNGELVRLIVKGSALGSENKDKNVYDFYSYIQSFKEGERNDHFYGYETVLYSVDEKSDLGSYKAMSFKQGDKLENLDDVELKMIQSFQFCEELDKVFDSKGIKEVKESVPTIDYEEEDDGSVPDEEIPF